MTVKKPRLLVLAFVLLLTCSLPLAAAADYQVYTLSDAGMELPLPTGWITLTRDTQDGDPALAQMGLGYQEFLQYFRQGDIYFDLIHPDKTMELIVSCVSNRDTAKMFDLNTMEPAEVEQYANALVSSEESYLQDLENNGGAYSCYARVQLPQALFLRMEGEIKTEGANIVFLQYSTVINGKGVSIQLRSYDGLLDASQTAMLDELVQQIHFTQVLTKGLDLYQVGAIALIVIGVAVILYLILIRPALRRRKEADVERRRAAIEAEKQQRNNWK